MNKEDIRKKFIEWRNDGEHESWSDKYGYIEKLDIEMVLEFMNEIVAQAVQEAKREEAERIYYLVRYQMPSLCRTDEQKMKDFCFKKVDELKALSTHQSKDEQVERK